MRHLAGRWARRVDSFTTAMEPCNPARGKRMRLRVPKPQRTFLELDELNALIDEAGAQDAPAKPKTIEADGGDTAARVAAMLSRGMAVDGLAVGAARQGALRIFMDGNLLPAGAALRSGVGGLERVWSATHRPAALRRFASIIRGRGNRLRRLRLLRLVPLR